MITKEERRAIFDKVDAGEDLTPREALRLCLGWDLIALGKESDVELAMPKEDWTRLRNAVMKAAGEEIPE